MKNSKNAISSKSQREGIERIKIPQPVSGGLMLSYKCSAACRHCMYACSPKWQGDWISEEDLEGLLSRLSGKILASPWGEQTISLNHGLHFTGGEPFLNFKLLLRAVEMAEELDIPSTFVETNCFWCRSDEVTREKLQELKNAGLKGILISVNPFYTEYVPFERTERCIQISLEVFGENVVVYQLEFLKRFRQMGIKDRMSIDEYMQRTKGECLAEKVELFLMGRASQKLRDLYSKYPASVFFYQPCRPPFLRDWHNHFDNYGNFIAGYCGGITLGRWRNLDILIKEGIDFAEYPILGYLVNEDIQGLLYFAQEFGYRESPEGYLSKCDLCLDIRKYLVSRASFDELNPKAFYRRLLD